MYQTTIPQFIKMLSNVPNYLDKAMQHAEIKKYDPNVLLQARLAPDQFPFIKQIQIACDTAKGAAARLAGKEAPKHEDNEKTIGELRSRVEKVVAYLKTFKEEDFRGYEAKKIDIYYLPGKTLTGFEFLHEMAIPNLYFHLTSAYSILRNNGVDVGKGDFLGKLNFQQK